MNFFVEQKLMQITTAINPVSWGAFTCIPEATDTLTSGMAFVARVRSTDLGLMANVTSAICYHAKVARACNPIYGCSSVRDPDLHHVRDPSRLLW